jgi:hypothetical protein
MIKERLEERCNDFITCIMSDKKTIFDLVDEISKTISNSLSSVSSYKFDIADFQEKIISNDLDKDSLLQIKTSLVDFNELSKSVMENISILKIK